MRRYLRTVRELSPTEWLPILRTDLAVCEEMLRQARRTGEVMPGYEVWRDDLVASIRELEVSDGMVLDTSGRLAHNRLATDQDVQV